MCPRCVKNVPCNPVGTSFFLNSAGMLQTICRTWLCFVSDSWLDDSAWFRQTWRNRNCMVFLNFMFVFKFTIEIFMTLHCFPIKSPELGDDPRQADPRVARSDLGCIFLWCFDFGLTFDLRFCRALWMKFLVEGTKIFLKNGIPEHLFY